MIRIRDLRESDYSDIQQMDFLFGLSIQWNGAFSKDDVVVAEDENGEIYGAAALAKDGTWYYLDSYVNHIQIYQMQVQYVIKDNVDNYAEILRLLLDGEKEKFKCYVNQYPNYTLHMRCWVFDHQKEELERLFRNGFYAHKLTPVLSFDLTNDIEIPEVDGKIHIGLHNCNDLGFEAYMKANALGYGNADSPDELLFRLHDNETCVFTAMDGDEVVSSCTVWRIKEKHSATENVFTIPKYQGRGLARATIATALKFLKERGDEEATLTVLGDNRKALSLYLSMGYHVKQALYELHWSS